MPAPLASDDGMLPYLRVLGFRQAATPLLHEIKQRAQAPLITRVPEAEQMLSGCARLARIPKVLVISKTLSWLLSMATV